MKLSGTHLRNRLAGTVLACMTAWFTVYPTALPASAVGGSCGSSAVWTLENGVLRISGTGDVTTGAWQSYKTTVTSIVVEAGITSLPSHAFDGFSALTSLKMPESVTSIGSYLCYNCQQLTTVEFPSQLAEIPLGAFNTCYAMESLSLPEGLKKIGSNAFYGNIALTALTLPAGVTDVGESAFYGNNIKQLSLSSSLQNIGANAFGMSCFSTVTIPDTVVSIGEGAIDKYYLSVSLKGNKISGTYLGSPGVTTIRGKRGSAAEQFASSAGLNFVAEGEDSHTHTWSEWKTTTSAGCEKAGLRTRTCTACGETESETIAATGHSWSAWETDAAAGCGQEGKEHRTCTNCGQTETRTVSATEHNWSAWETDTPAGCGQEGKEHRTCTNCGQTETRTVSATEHNWSAWETDTPAGCGQEGKEHRTCTNCGQMETRTVSATEHNWGAWETDTPAGCEHVGKEHRSCTNCGQTETRTISATGHSFGEWTVVREATLTEEGLRERVCRNSCGTVLTEPIPKLTGYTISVTAGEGGTVSPSGVTAVEAGSSLTVTVIPNSGWHIASLLIDGAEATLNWDGTYTFTNIRTNHTMSVVFQQDAVQAERTCGLITVRTSRTAWYSDESAFKMRDFSILASITENGNTVWTDITAACEPLLTPAAAADIRYGNSLVSFRYTGSDDAVLSYLQKNIIQAEVSVYLRGDGNGNRQVELGDAILTLQAYVESAIVGNVDGLNDVQRVILDVDEKNGITLADAIFILQYYTQVIVDMKPSWSDIIP